jgi:hypothetical protein
VTEYVLSTAHGRHDRTQGENSDVGRPPATQSIVKPKDLQVRVVARAIHRIELPARRPAATRADQNGPRASAVP